MLGNFDELQKLGKHNLEATTKTFEALAKSTQSIASEVTNYSRKSLEDGSTMMGKLLGAKTPEQAVEIQADFARTALEGYIAGLTKISELYADLAKETFKSFEPKVANVASMK